MDVQKVLGKLTCIQQEISMNRRSAYQTTNYGKNERNRERSTPIFGYNTAFDVQMTHSLKYWKDNSSIYNFRV